MKKYLILLYIFSFTNCNKKIQNKSLSDDTKPVYVYYDAINSFNFSDKNSRANISIHIKGFDFYQSRYVIPYDEKNKSILEIYKKNDFRNITTLFSFSNLRKDTIYFFPLTDSKEFPVFGAKYKNSKNGHITDTIDVYFKIYQEKSLGKVAIVDSVR